ncbi:MAG: hypothetical protein EOO15_09405 [Chitinophagaceae bacterium]|nr:MAG: hypothetical protein EOO15_09405 [Chitinophagaceae bacterium]
MGRSFEIVEFKVAEADFFLEKLKETAEYAFQFFEARNYLSAFLSAARSISFSIQSSLTGVEGFDTWYAVHQKALRESKLAKYFVEARNLSQKVGYYPIVSAMVYADNAGKRIARYIFDQSSPDLKSEAPEIDVVEACSFYFRILLEIVLDSYRCFGTVIDPEQYYSIENLHKSGKTIEDFEQELGYPRGWTRIADDISDQKRLEAIRGEIKYEGVDHILIKYLGFNRFGDKVDES